MVSCNGLATVTLGGGGLAGFFAHPANAPQTSIITKRAQAERWGAFIENLNQLGRRSRINPPASPQGPSVRNQNLGGQLRLTLGYASIISTLKDELRA
jgi:hypothetical protein